jgi:type II secretory pathway pseudopilin PulG
MAVLFLLLAFLVVVVLAAAGLENTDASSATLFDRTFDQLTEGQLLILAAALGFLVALFLFLAFGASRTRRSRRKELRSRRRDAESRVDELERENARLTQELETVERNRSDAVAERDRAESAADRLRSDPATAPPTPTSVRRERLDDRTGASPTDQHARAAAEEEARRR